MLANHRLLSNSSFLLLAKDEVLVVQLAKLAFLFLEPGHCLFADSVIKPVHSDVCCLIENEHARAKEVVMAMDAVVAAASLLCQ